MLIFVYYCFKIINSQQKAKEDRYRDKERDKKREKDKRDDRRDVRGPDARQKDRDFKGNQQIE